MKKSFQTVALALFALALVGMPLRADRTAPSDGAPSNLAEKVRRELVTLPFYSVFDDLNYEVTGDTVTLTGQVTRPTLKSDAESVVKRIPGINKVVNRIAVLPLSSADNQIRRAAYWRLFNYNSPLFRYGLGADPSIHIIVENGHVTLKGTVSNQSDKNIASLYVQGLFGVFSVTNNLNVGARTS